MLLRTARHPYTVRSRGCWASDAAAGSDWSSGCSKGDLAKVRHFGGAYLLSPTTFDSVPARSDTCRSGRGRRCRPKRHGPRATDEADPKRGVPCLD